MPKPFKRKPSRFGVLGIGQRPPRPGSWQLIFREPTWASGPCFPPRWRGRLLGAERRLWGCPFTAWRKRWQRGAEAVDYSPGGYHLQLSLPSRRPKTGGVARIEEVRGRTDVPLLAIGGVTPERVEGRSSPPGPTVWRFEEWNLGFRGALRGPPGPSLAELQKGEGRWT
jgi:hypothetical protein